MTPKTTCGLARYKDKYDLARHERRRKILEKYSKMRSANEHLGKIGL